WNSRSRKSSSTLAAESIALAVVWQAPNTLPTRAGRRARSRDWQTALAERLIDLAVGGGSIRSPSNGDNNTNGAENGRDLRPFAPFESRLAQTSGSLLARARQPCLSSRSL